MKNKIYIILLCVVALSLQANPLSDKTLKELKISLEIIELDKWEATTNMDSGEIIDTAAYCKSLGSPKKSKQELQEYFLNSILIDSDSKNYYSIWQCDYSGKVKIFGKIWDFWSVSGLTRLSRKVDKSYKSLNEFEVYCDDKNCYEVIYLVCKDKSCIPKAQMVDKGV